MATQRKYLDSTGLSYFFTKIKEIFISDAPIDGKKYLRQNNDWVEYIDPSSDDIFQVSGNTLLTSNEFQIQDENLILS